MRSFLYNGLREVRDSAEGEEVLCVKNNISILVIGNGFDLYHGLPTRYRDFLFLASHWKDFRDAYDCQDRQIATRPGEQITVRLGPQNELTGQSLQDFACHRDLFPPEHIAFLDKHICNNAWIAYFIQNKPLGHNWVDFESEIERALRQVEDYFQIVLPSVRNGMPTKPMTELMRIVFSIFGERSETGSFIMGRGFFDLSSKDPEMVRVYKEWILSSMKSELDALNRCLSIYIQDFISILRCGVWSPQIRDLNRVCLLDFNYTNTFRLIYGESRIVQHHSVHGRADQQNLVLGIPDESFPETLDYVYFQKYFQRIQKRTGNFYRKWLTGPAEGLPAQVFLMGHSLNRMDRGILKDFFEDEKQVERITVFYNNQAAFESQVINLVAMFGRDFVIDQTGTGRIVFEELQPPVKRPAET